MTDTPRTLIDVNGPAGIELPAAKTIGFVHTDSVQRQSDGANTESERLDKYLQVPSEADVQDFLLLELTTQNTRSQRTPGETGVSDVSAIPRYFNITSQDSISPSQRLNRLIIRVADSNTSQSTVYHEARLHLTNSPSIGSWKCK